MIWLVAYHLHIKEKAEAPKWNPEVHEIALSEKPI